MTFAGETPLRKVIPTDRVGNVVNYVETSTGSGVYVNPVAVVPAANQATPSPATFDSFSRTATAEPRTTIYIKQVDNTAFREFIDDVQVSGAGTSSVYLNTRSSTVITTSAGIAGRRIFQTKRRHYYEPGKTSFITMSFGSIGTIVAGGRAAVGIFNDNNGLFFENDEGVLKFIVRTDTSGVPGIGASIEQANWNLDTLDGNGPSGVTLVPLAIQLFVVEFPWQGAGSIRFGFVINGQVIFCHREDVSNTLPNLGVFMRTPHLPLRWEIENKGTAATPQTLECICGSAQILGSTQNIGLRRTAIRDTIFTAVLANTYYPLVSVRVSDPDCIANIIAISAINLTNTAFHWLIIRNPTITGGAAAVWTPLTDSGIEYDVTADGVITLDQERVESAGYLSFLPGSPIVAPEISIGVDASGVSDIYTLAVNGLTLANRTFLGNIVLEEKV